jgi:hypothetical protein
MRFEHSETRVRCVCAGRFRDRIQQSELEYLFGSEKGQAVPAEHYVGLPFWSGKHKLCAIRKNSGVNRAEDFCGE